MTRTVKKVVKTYLASLAFIAYWVTLIVSVILLVQVSLYFGIFTVLWAAAGLTALMVNT